MSLKVRGPKALMESNIVPDGLTIFVLNNDREIEAMYTPQEWKNQQVNYVIVSKNQTEDVSFIKEEIVNLSNDLINTSGSYCLDALVQKGNRWWSAMCDDLNCCPPEGNLIEQKKPTIEMVDKIIEDLKKDDIPSTDFELVVNDIEMRDDLLVKLNKFNLWDSIINLTTVYTSAQALSIQACAYYIKNDNEKTREYLNKVLDAGGTSFAQLIQTGFELGAPSSMIVSTLFALEK